MLVLTRRVGETVNLAKDVTNRLLIFIALLTGGVGVAWGDAGMVYLGAGVTHDKLTDFILNANPENTRGFPDISATSWKAVLGWHPAAPFAVEMDYYGQAGNTRSLGSPGQFTERSEARAFAGYAVALLPLEWPVDPYAKLGASRWRLTAAGTEGQGERDTGTGFAWALGAQAHLGRVGARIEYEQLSMGRTNGLQLVSFVVTVNVL